MDEARRRAKLAELRELAEGSPEFEGGVTYEEEMEALIVGDWAIFAVDEIGDLALSFHLDAHPVAVAKLTRFLVQHEVPFVLHEAFTVDENDEIVFESDTGRDLPGHRLASARRVLRFLPELGGRRGGRPRHEARVVLRERRHDLRHRHVRPRPAIAADTPCAAAPPCPWAGTANPRGRRTRAPVPRTSRRDRGRRPGWP